MANSPTPTATLSATASEVPPPSGPPRGALPGCLPPLPGGGRCTGELECFDPVRVRGTTAQAERVPCAGRHTWEAYAVGDLTAELDGADHETVKADRTVRQVCSEHSFRATTLLMTTTGWQFEVLPPTAQAVAAGDRSFRCLAGRGAHGLSRPTLSR